MSLYERFYKQADAPSAPPPSSAERVPGMKPDFVPAPHQERAVRRLLENDGKMVMAHQVGTGKTSASVYGFEKMKQLGRASKAIVIVPAGLRENFLEGGVQKFTNDTGNIAMQPDKIDPNAVFNIVSYETFRQDPAGIMQRSGADTMICDEYHRLRNDDSSTYQALTAGRQYAKNFIGLTGSLINNNPSEIAPLLALSENNPHLTKEDFKDKFIKTVGVTETFTGKARKLLGLKNPAQFARAVYPSVDYVTTEDIPGNNMPRKDVKYVPVSMSDQQYHMYQLALNKLGPISEYISRRDSNVKMKDTDRVFTQIMQARQIANSIETGRKDVSLEQAATGTPKVQRIISDTVKHLADKPDNNVVLYTNLVRGGIDVLSAGLDAAGVPHALFIGKGTEIDGNTVTEDVRQAGVRDFKEGKKRVIVISGAGAEGLDLKNATAFYALDGHYNPERILQAEARARRLGGQAQRPAAQRVVDVRRYQSVAPGSAQPGVFGRMLGATAPRTTDQWMYELAANKFKTNKQFTDVLHKPSKYIRKEYTDTGKVRYVYAPAQESGLWGKFFGPKQEAAKQI